MRSVTARLIAAGALFVLGSTAAGAFAQPETPREQRQAQRQAQRQGGAPEGEPVVTPAEIQRMFDSYALMQAQEQLKIADAQFPQFLTRFKALQDVRRMQLNQHMRRVMELRRLLNTGAADEAALREQLKALDELDVKSQAEVRKAYEALAQVLTVEQQARFRVFEELMERRKLELVTRARQANRAKQ